MPCVISELVSVKWFIKVPLDVSIAILFNYVLGVNADKEWSISRFQSYILEAVLSCMSLKAPIRGIYTSIFQD